MKREVILSLGIVIIFLLGGLYFYFQRPIKTSISSKETPTSLVTSIKNRSRVSPTKTIKYCTPQDLKASVDLSAGAGNIYATFNLKNTSNETCQILGGNYINVNYDTSSIKNITITHVGTNSARQFILSGGQSLYSQAHYHNGPQCQSIGINSTAVIFTYDISPKEIVIFMNQEGNTKQVIQTCKSPSDITNIQIWNISDQPITP